MVYDDSENVGDIYNRPQVVGKSRDGATWVMVVERLQCFLLNGIILYECFFA